MAGEKVYEMLWDCEYCGSKKLLGKTHRHCPNCGAAQDPTRRYFPDEADKVAVVDHVYYGKDKICPFCSTPNSAKATYCGNCGGSLDGSKEVQTRTDQIVGTSTDSVSAAKADFENQKNSEQPNSPNLLGNASPEPQNLSPEKKKISPWLKYGLIGSVSSLVLFFLVGVLWTEKVIVQVSGHTWIRTIEIERFQPVSESEWCDARPSDAYNVSRRSEVRSYDQVADGEDCRTVRSDNGDGTFSESESCSTRYKSVPVYDDKCYYTVDRWKVDRSAKSEGDSIIPDPYWPQIQLKTCSLTTLGCEREGSKGQEYKVHFKESQGKTQGEAHHCEFPQEKWKTFSLDSEFEVEKSVILDFISCDTLKAL